MDNLPEVSEQRKQEIENFINQLNLFETYYLIYNMIERIAIPSVRSTDDPTEFILREETAVQVAIKRNRVHLLTGTYIEDLRSINREIAVIDEEQKITFNQPLAKC